MNTSRQCTNEIQRPHLMQLQNRHSPSSLFTTTIFKRKANVIPWWPSTYHLANDCEWFLKTLHVFTHAWLDCPKQTHELSFDHMAPAGHNLWKTYCFSAWIVCGWFFVNTGVGHMLCDLWFLDNPLHLMDLREFDLLFMDLWCWDLNLDLFYNLLLLSHTPWRMHNPPNQTTSRTAAKIASIQFNWETSTATHGFRLAREQITFQSLLRVHGQSRPLSLELEHPAHDSQLPTMKLESELTL